METVGRLRNKESQRLLWCVILTRRTMNSSGSGPIFMRILCFEENPSNTWPLMGENLDMLWMKTQQHILVMTIDRL
jgi:hypothetical protein